MKLCNDTVTVFTASVDQETKTTVYAPTVIAGVSWFAANADTVDPKGGLVAANRATIRIPEDADTGGKAYADPVRYASAGDVSGLWTLKGGDIVVRAAVEGSDWTPARLKAAYAECVTVLAVTDNRRGPRAAHWRVTGT